MRLKSTFNSISKEFVGSLTIGRACEQITDFCVYRTSRDSKQVGGGGRCVHFNVFVSGPKAIAAMQLEYVECTPLWKARVQFDVASVS